ncbi:glycosyltransferase [Nitratidesulfovibrio sp. D1]|uniref:glycosyltransferase n=1 Tax=Nitratidesulfovibrio sp. D1 TaxID=3440151 RepID=UPI003EB9646B
MNTSGPCVLVYNPISGHGHLDSWNVLFVKLLLKRGWRVLALTPNAAVLSSCLESEEPSGALRLQILDWDMREDMKSADVSPLRYAWNTWIVFCKRYYFRWPEGRATPDMPFFMYWKRRTYHVVVPMLYRITCFLQDGWQYFSKCSRDDSEKDLASPVDMARRVKEALKRARWTPGIAFNMYMDTYRTRVSEWEAFDAINVVPWAGLRFWPPDTPRDAWYSLFAWRGMCYLDETICRARAGALPHKYFAWLPDITETALPDTPCELVQAIRRQGAGRKIVFLGGAISNKKNLAHWFKLISLADPSQWFFVQVGEILRHCLPDEDLVALQEVLADPPENFLLREGYLSDEREFNAIIAASDMIFAVYRDFHGSSNSLGKAAHFRKPILVSNRYVMGKRVQEYGIGRAVPEDDAALMLQALHAFVRSPIPEENFSAYCEAFSHEKLSDRLDFFLRDCMRSDCVDCESKGRCE